MRGQHRLDQQVGEHRLEFLEAHALVAQPREYRLQTFGLRIAAGRPGPLAPDPVDLLGEVDHPEPRGKSTHEVQRFDRIVESALAFQRIASGGAVAPVDGRGAGGLDPHEQILAALLPQKLAHHAAEFADVVAQRIVLGGEIDFFALHRSSWNGNGNVMLAADRDDCVYPRLYLRKSRDETPGNPVNPALFTTRPSRGVVRPCGWGVSRPSAPEAYSPVRRGCATERNTSDAGPDGAAAGRVVNKAG